MALGSAGIACETVEVSLRAKPSELLAISPKGTVPVMQLMDGTVLEQSLDIMRWALAQNDPEGWLTAADENEMKRVIAQCDDVFKPLLDRYKYANRHPELLMEQHRSLAMDALQAMWNDASQPCTSESPYLFGLQASMVDVALFPFVRQFAAVDSVWFAAQPLPRLQAWLATWLASDLFTAIMKK